MNKLQSNFFWTKEVSKGLRSIVTHYIMTDEGRTIKNINIIRNFYSVDWIKGLNIYFMGLLNDIYVLFCVCV